MKLFVAANPCLKPYLERMLPSCPHAVTAVYAPDFAPARLRQLLPETAGYDAVLFLDGAAALEHGAPQALDIPLVFPRVHNCAALLLGSAARYRALFSQQDGGICWQTAGSGAPLFFTPPADCACLCFLADTTLGLPDDSLGARAQAQKNGLDYLAREIDLSLLERLLSGDWDNKDCLVVSKGQTAFLTHTHTLLEVR